MDARHKNAGVVVDERLAPAGLTRLLGGYGNARRTVLGLAARSSRASPCSSCWRPPRSPRSARCSSCRSRSSRPRSARARGWPVPCSASRPCSRAPRRRRNGDGAVARHRAVARPVLPRVRRRSPRPIAPRSRRRMLEQVLEATTDSIYLKDLDGRYLLVNSATARLIGRPGDEILGRTNRELLPEVADEIADHDAEVIERDTPDGVRDHGPLRRPALHPVGHEEPVSRRDRRDDRLARDRARHHRAAPDAGREHALLRPLGRHALHGRLRRPPAPRQRRVAQDARLEPRRAASAVDVSELMDREDHAAHGRGDARRSAKGGAGRERHDALARTRTARGAGSTGRCARSPTSACIYASGRDVTQRLDDERALAASESRYRALVHGLPGTAVFLVDRELNLEFASGKPLRAGGDAPRKLVGAHVERRPARARSTATVVDACSAALAGEERGFDVVSAEHRLALWVRTSPLRGDGAEIVGAMLIAQDVHERVEREREISRGAGALPPRLRGRPDRDGGRRPRRQLPRGQPGAVRDHGLRRRRRSAG